MIVGSRLGCLQIFIVLHFIFIRNPAPPITWRLDSLSCHFDAGSESVRYKEGAFNFIISIMVAFGVIVVSEPVFASSVDAKGGRHIIKSFDGSRRLIFDACDFGIQVQRARFSFDKSAVIVSDASFLRMSDILSCSGRPLIPTQIDPSIGILVDVNVSAKLFLTLDVVSTMPLAYLATVAKFGSKRNLVSLPGAYVEGLSLSDLQEHGFSYDPDEPPRIAPNGRYVSPGGAPDCASDAYPGVWDLMEGKRVIFVGMERKVRDRCEALFR